MSYSYNTTSSADNNAAQTACYTLTGLAITLSAMAFWDKGFVPALLMTAAFGAVSFLLAGSVIRLAEAIAKRHRITAALVIVMASIRPDRRSGGFRLVVQQVWDLATARCRFGKYLRVAVNGRAPDVHRLVREFPPQRVQSEQGELLRGLPVRLAVRRDQATAELQLGDEAKFFPSDAALASWMAQADAGQAQIVYETA